MADFFSTLETQTDQTRQLAVSSTRLLADFQKRLEQILSQDHREITIRDSAFQQDFTQFCQLLREQTDQMLSQWQTLREQARTLKTAPTSLQAKGFTMRAKTLSRAADELISTWDSFYVFYKKYTLTKLPVWILTSCCDDVNNLSGKILFLSRELSKRAGLTQGA